MSGRVVEKSTSTANNSARDDVPHFHVRLNLCRCHPEAVLVMCGSLHHDLGGRGAIELLRQRRGTKRHSEEAIIGRAADWDAALSAGADRRSLLEWFKARLAARAYLRTVIDDLSEALGEGLESDVSHRRH